MTPNEIIAEYDGLVHCNSILCYTNNSLCWSKDGHAFFPKDRLQYDTSMDWLYPVYIKLRKELSVFIDQHVAYKTDEALHVYSTAKGKKGNIEHALLSGSISELHAEIVKGITFLNEQKK